MKKSTAPAPKRSQEVMKRSLLRDVREMIAKARSSVAVTVNAGLTILYWRVGERIRKDILQEKRAEYGKEIVATLARPLEIEFGRGFGRRNLFRMVRFAETFPDPQIVSSLMTQLGWTGKRMNRLIPEENNDPQITQMTQMEMKIRTEQEDAR